MLNTLSGEAAVGIAGCSRATDPKTELTVFLQRLCQRSLTKQDVLYAVSGQDGHFQATVRLVCLQDEEYVGDVCPTDKAAEHSAAQQALLAHAADAAALLVPKPGKKKQAKQAAGGLLAKPQQPLDRKTELVNHLQLHCQRNLTKPDVLYTVAEVGHGQFQASVKLVCLQGAQEYVGQLCTDAKASEHAAAEQALMAQAMWMPPESLSMLPEVEAAANQKRKADQAANQGVDAKTELTAILQRMCHRTLVKTDVVYSVVAEGNLFRASVKLICLQGTEFMGELSPTTKAAEQSAAQQALLAYAAQAAALPAAVKRRRAPRPGVVQPAQPSLGFRPPVVVRAPLALQGAQAVQPLGFLAGGIPFGAEALRH
mmetsp:Transcript_103437/g.333578  ORF Transcript_103437/g.333578 Transcript_103437/m.333578 type:complete len:370 (-) Transcript_103437:29-1138(-)